jgi:hypothetical protein
MTEGTMTEGDEAAAEDAAEETPVGEIVDGEEQAAADAGDGGRGAGSGTTEAVAVPDGPGEEPVKDRLILPLLIPWLSILAVALLTLNISRVFLAGDSTSALVIASLITVGILIGAAALSAAPGARTSSLAMFLVLSLVILVSAGLVSLGPSLESHEDGEATGWVEPPPPADSTLTVVAGPGTSFSGVKFDMNYDAEAAGVIEIDYTGDSGHTLLFRDPELAGFELATGGREKARVDLKPGEYEIYCNVTGHAAQGMVGTITVP